MKNIYKGMLIALFLSLLAISASAQIITSTVVKSAAQIKAVFARTEGLVDASISNRQSAPSVIQGGSDNERSRWPLGEEPLFVLGSNREFASRGETVDINLYPTITSNRTVQIYAQISKPGILEGEYDGTEQLAYLTANNGNYGVVEGMRFLQAIKLTSWTFNDSDNLGRYTFNIIVTDVRGKLIQQVIYDVYLTNAGRWGRWRYARNAQSTESSINLTGRFPVNTPIYYVFYTKDAGSLITGQDPQNAAYSNGTNISLSGMLGYSRTTPISIGMWNPNDRYAFVLPNGLADEAVPQ